MILLRVRRLRLPALGGLLGVTGLVALRRARRGSKARWPTADALLKMSDSQFETFVSSTGLQTVTSAGLALEDPGTH